MDAGAGASGASRPEPPHLRRSPVNREPCSTTLGVTVDDLPHGMSKLLIRVIGRVIQALGLIERWDSIAVPSPTEVATTLAGGRPDGLHSQEAEAGTARRRLGEVSPGGTSSSVVGHGLPVQRHRSGLEAQVPYRDGQAQPPLPACPEKPVPASGPGMTSPSARMPTRALFAIIAKLGHNCSDVGWISEKVVTVTL